MVVFKRWRLGALVRQPIFVALQFFDGIAELFEVALDERKVQGVHGLPKVRGQRRLQGLHESVHAFEVVAKEVSPVVDEDAQALEECARDEDLVVGQLRRGRLCRHAQLDGLDESEAVFELRAGGAGRTLRFGSGP